MSTPPPDPGPRPPGPLADGPTDPSMPVVPDYVKGKVNRLARQMTAGILVGAIGTCFGVFFALEARAERMLELRVAPIEKEQAHQKDDLHEIGKDVRELYRVMPKWGPSERLEQPFPEHADGGR